MRGLFIGLAAAPLVLMNTDGAGAGGGGSDRDRNRAQRGTLENVGVGGVAPSEEAAAEAAEGNFGEGAVPDRGQAPGERGTSSPGTQPGRQGGTNQLRPQDENRPGPQSGPVRGAPVDERLRRAVVVLGIPGSLAARANTLF